MLELTAPPRRATRRARRRRCRSCWTAAARWPVNGWRRRGSRSPSWSSGSTRPTGSGVVAFDDEVTVVVPAGPVLDKAAVAPPCCAIAPGGTTNLSGGLLRGLQEARRVAGPAGATLLLLSDGHANVGVTDADRLADVAAGARAHGVTTSTVGIGLGYDETLLAAIARGGQGTHAFAEDGDGAGAVVAGEVDGLLSKTVQAASLIIRPRGVGARR